MIRKRLAIIAALSSVLLPYDHNSLADETVDEGTIVKSASAIMGFDIGLGALIHECRI